MTWIVRIIAALAAYLQKQRLAKREREAKVDINARCPACGHTNGKDGRLTIKFVEVKDKQDPEPWIEHTCAVCGAQWYEPTILKPEKWFRRPQNARS